jgi:Helix-turn-helix domain
MMRRNEVELFEAIEMTDLEEETLLRLAEAGELKARRAGGTVYFEREEIDALIDRMVADAREEIAS